MLIGRYSLPAMKLGNIHIVDTEALVGKGSSTKTNPCHLEAMVRAFETALYEIKADIVNVHDICDFSIKCMEICIARNIPCVYTEHLYIGFNRKINGYDKTVIWEKDIYNLKGIKVIAVSAGIKKRIMEDFPHRPEKDIHVIKNGTDFQADIVSDDLMNKKVEPFVPFEERIELVRSCRYVDEAVEIPLQYNDTREAYKLYHFDCQFSGSDYINRPAWISNKEFLEQNGSEMVFFPYTESTSSSKIKALIEKKLM